MALEGTLSDFNIHEIFQKVSDSKNTGILTIYSGEDTVTVTFLEGQVVAATTSDKRPEDRLGNFLVRHNYVPEADLKRALADQEQTLDRLGQILLKKKIIDKPTLQKALQEQLKQIVGRLLNLTSGFYHFKVEEKVHYDQENVIPTPVEAILLSSVADDDDEEDAAPSDIPSLDIRFRKTSSADEFIVKELKSLGDFLIGEGAPPKPGTVLESDLDVSPLQKRLIKTLETTRTLNEIFAEHSESQAEIIRALDHLKKIGFVEEVRPEETETDDADEDFDDFYEEGESFSLTSLAPFLLVAIILTVVALAGGNPLRPFGPMGTADAGQIERIALQFNMDRLITAMRMYIYSNQAAAPPLVLGSLVDDANIIEREITVDPWGHEFQYTIQQLRFVLTSSGPDGTADTADDIRLAATYMDFQTPPMVYFPPTLNAQSEFFEIARLGDPAFGPQ